MHANSNVHNKAAYNLLTATKPGSKGKRAALVFTPVEVAQLYYLLMQRLDRTADFEDAYFALLEAARTHLPIPEEQAEKVAAITRAYAAVGIARNR